MKAAKPAKAEKTKAAKPGARPNAKPAKKLIRGRFLNVDDPITDAEGRGQGHGERLLQALCELGRTEGKQARISASVSACLSVRFLVMVPMRAGLCRLQCS
ncbi:hypothetical protein KB879_34725 (plasmid) [Cupriavidus sp. KK10]|uniref:hypothetical protein n=1 Tax=Cupriavidus sp. KK10 TaxID=1478019 RepID=UPI001BAD92BB|nr:hypothetical protein [Cupriavidus sp. KK10]QUN32989.1 hypothetical protein KB879_34725 [Cupriavidus sp. KK10]